MSLYTTLQKTKEELPDRLRQRQKEAEAYRQMQQVSTVNPAPPKTAETKYTEAWQLATPSQTVIPARRNDGAKPDAEKQGNDIRWQAPSPTVVSMQRLGENPVSKNNFLNGMQKMLTQNATEQEILSVEEMQTQLDDLDRQISDLSQQQQYYTNLQKANSYGLQYMGPEAPETSQKDALDQLKAERGALNAKLEQAKATEWENRQREEILEAGGEELLSEILKWGGEFAKRGQSREQGEKIREITNSLKAQGYSSEQISNWFSYADRVNSSKSYEENVVRAAQFAKEHPAVASISAVPLKLLSGVGAVSALSQKAANSLTGSDTPVNYKSAAMLPYGTSDAIIGQVASDIEKKTNGWVGSNTAFGNLYSDAYQLTMSMAESLGVVGLTAIGVPGAIALLGGSAATSAMVEAKDRGASDAQALMMALMSGVAETLFEKVSIDSLFTLESPTSVKSALKNILKQAVPEASEELNTTLANTLSDMIIMGDKSQLETARRNYMASGMTAQEADKKAASDWFNGLMADALGGAVSGGFFAMGSNAMSSFQNGKLQAAIQETLFPAEKQQNAQKLDAAIQESIRPTQDAESQVTESVASENAKGLKSLFNATKEQIISFVSKSFRNENNYQFLRISEVSDDLAQKVGSGGIDIEGYVHALRDNDLRHIRKSHGDLSSAKYPVTVEDLENVSDVINNYDNLYIGYDTKGGNKTIVYEKTINTKTFYVEEVLDDGVLSTKQMLKTGKNSKPSFLKKYKKITGSSSDTDVPQNAETTGQSPLGNHVQDAEETTSFNTSIPNPVESVNWNIKKDAALGGEKLGKNAASPGTSSAAPVDDTLGGGGGGNPAGRTGASSVSSFNNTVAQPGLNVNGNTGQTYGGVGDMGQGSVGAAQSGFDPYSHAANTYGTIEPGENPSRIVDVPKSMDGESNVMQTVRTILEAGVTTDETVPALEQAVVNGDFSAMTITDRAAAERAEAVIRQKGYTQALADWRSDMKNGKVSKDNVALGETLYNAAVSAGDTKSAVKIAVDLAASVRNAAQAVQAVRMLKKMSPAAQLYGVKQSIDSLQEQLKTKYGDRAPELTIDEDLAAAFLEADTDEARAAAEEALYKSIAAQIPATFMDKWNAWRYLSMLGNPRTHIRNILGNAMFAPVRGAKNQLGALMETIAEKAGWIDKSQRTKSLGFNLSQQRQALLEAAKADYDSVAKDLILSGGKYNSATSIIDQNRRIFNNAVLETLRQGNSYLLDEEDSWFSKPAYASSLAGYLNAQGFTAEDFTGNGMTDAQKDKARAYAVSEAQKATYRDINAFSDMISSIGFKNPGRNMFKQGVNTMLEGVMPFKKTPANILARGMEYSPAGLAKALTVDISQVANGKMTAAEYMDHLSSGLTGTLLFGLGFLLSNLGLLTGGSPEDEDQANLEGRQPYALEIGDTSVTLDWLAPEALPVFMGVELSEAIQESAGKTVTMDSLKSFFNGLTGPVLEMSMMSSLQDAMEATTYADNKVMAFLSNSALGYMGQAFPTLFGQLERTVSDQIRKSTFTQKGGFLDTDTQYALGTFGNKIPFWDYSQVPYIDAWGRTKENGNMGARAFNNMLNPAYVSKIDETPVDQEIKRLEQATGENLTPSRAETKLTVNKETILLTADEYVTYATAKGQNDYTLRENLINSEDYQGLDDEVKVKAMDYARSYADELARQEAGIQDVKTSWMQELAEADAGTVTQTLISKAVESVLPSGAARYETLSGMVEGGLNDAAALAILSDSQMDAYVEYIKDAKIPVDVYLDVLGAHSSATADKDKNGNSIPGSKQAKDIEYIDGLKLTKAQKRALFLSLYSSEKNLPDKWK